MFSLSIQSIALWPAKVLVGAVLMLFGWELDFLPDGWRVIILGVVALMFWSWVLRGLIGFIQRRVFKFYAASKGR